MARRIRVAKMGIPSSLSIRSIAAPVLLLAVLSPPATPAGTARAPVVVLPPPRVGAINAKTTEAAELLCDQLSEKLSAAGARVVSRAELKKVLAERKLATRPAGPALAYDAIVRLRVETLTPVPNVTISVVDLALGNRLWSGKYPWPMKDAVLAEAAGQVAKAAGRAPGAAGGRLKVRLVSATSPDRTPRLEPLCRDLLARFGDLLTGQRGMVAVRHLEAATAKEESLLLLMGMSRLVGGKAFAPQADVTIEFTLRELAAVGKTFEQTTVEVRFRLAQDKAGPWRSVRGKIGQWDGLVEQVWRALAGELKQADPKAVTAVLDAMALRRRQAAAEMAKFRWREWQYARTSEDEVRRRAEAASAAAKIDPTWEDAAFWALFCRLRAAFRKVSHIRVVVDHHAKGRELLVPLVAEGLDYLERFRGNHGHRQRILAQILGAGYLTALQADPRSAELLDLTIRALAVGLSEPLVVNDGYWRPLGHIERIHQQMRTLGIPKAKADAWRLEAVRRADARVVAVGRFDGYLVRLHLAQTRLAGIRLALDAGRKEEARQLAVDLMKRVKPKWTTGVYRSAELQRQVDRIGDKALSGRMRRWIHGNRAWSEGLLPMRIEPPTLTAKDGPARPPRVQPDRVVPVRMENFALIGEMDGHMYGLYDTRGNAFGLVAGLGRVNHYVFAVCRVPLDKKGLPVGKLVGLDVPMAEKTAAHTGALLDGKVYVGTNNGIQVFDVAKKAWRVLRGEQGVPATLVLRLQALDERTLFCVGREPKAYTTFTLDVRTGKVSLLHRATGRPRPPLVAIWRNGRGLMGLSRSGLVKLAGHTWKVQTPFLPRLASGWPAELQALQRHLRWWGVASGRRFVICGESLYQVAEAGKVVRAWSFNEAFKFKSSLPAQMVAHPLRMDIPTDLPAVALGAGLRGRPRAMTNGRHLFVPDFGNGVVCYDPQTDTWAGPVRIGDGYFSAVFASAGGLWGKTSSDRADKRFVCVSTASLLKAAAGAGLTWTSDQLKARRDKLVAGAPALDRAKFTIALRRFDEARRVLEKILKAEPRNAEAMLLMGFVLDYKCLNRPAEAMAWYKKAAALDTPEAALAAMVLQCWQHAAAGRWVEALAVTDAAMARFNLGDAAKRDFKNTRRALAKKARSRETSKQAPRATNGS